MQKREIDIHHIGSRIKSIRKLRGFTLQSVATHTGLSTGYLSNIENNISSPPLDSLQKICDVLETSISDLLSTDRQEIIFIPRRSAKVTEYPQFNQRVERYDFCIDSQIYEYITIRPGPMRSTPDFRHSYDEVCTVVKGEMTVRLGDEIFHMKERDSLFIMAHQSHIIYNETESPCVSFWIHQRKEEHPPLS